jgi:AdoMet-dependent rRNA methyltransferase SPB1
MDGGDMEAMLDGGHPAMPGQARGSANDDPDAESDDDSDSAVEGRPARPKALTAGGKKAKAIKGRSDADAGAIVPHGEVEGSEEALRSETRASRWFSQDIFKGVGGGSTVAERKKKEDKIKALHKDSDEESDEDPDAVDTAALREFEDEELPALPLTDKEKRKIKKRREEEKLQKLGKRPKSGGHDDDNAAMEVAPMEAPKPLVPTSAHQKPADPRELAETLALGSILVSSKKARMQLIDAAYNRYAFDRDDTLPEWFQEDEDKHNQPELPITKELMKTFRDKLREINARPIRKVLEAKARKKRRLKLRLEKLRSTAMTLSENGEMSDIAKARHMRQAVSAMARQEQRKVSVVAIKKTGGGHKSDKGKTPKGAKTKVVDRRMKSDTRGQKKALKRNKGKVSAKIKRKMQKTHASKNRQHKNVGGTSKKQAGIYGKSTA